MSPTENFHKSWGVHFEVKAMKEFLQASRMWFFRLWHILGKIANQSHSLTKRSISDWQDTLNGYKIWRQMAPGRLLEFNVETKVITNRIFRQPHLVARKESKNNIRFLIKVIWCKICVLISSTFFQVSAISWTKPSLIQNIKHFDIQSFNNVCVSDISSQLLKNSHEKHAQKAIFLV